MEHSQVFSFLGPQPPPPQQFYASPLTPCHSMPSSSMRPLNTSPNSSSPSPFSLSQSPIGCSSSALSLRPSSFGFNLKPEQPVASSSSSHLYWSVRDSATQTEMRPDSTPITASMLTGTTGCRLFGIDLVNSSIEESVHSHFTATHSRGVSSSVIGHATTPIPMSIDVASKSCGVGSGVTPRAPISLMNQDAMVGSDVICGRDVGRTEHPPDFLDFNVADAQSKGLQVNQNSANFVTAASSEQMPPVEPPCRHVRSCTKVS
jgi:hypothetical protein